ncbi:hypothetical protein EDC22_101257 [Tepidamorphus gemmatus]|uniref:DUF1134 domain-containing protein n=1 Tax=Tepidamorphus gemmatus TaxID=747076 RepID=A0A4R3MID3_9HYPH|nr:DUF1134 domain-containing protein [Tepidamorphus gemmatus]TCT13392.1 hypothetical protein EDC22_101257 [Tepidamorphus gemmatus]
MTQTRRSLIIGVAALAAGSLAPVRLIAQAGNPNAPSSYTIDEIIEEGHSFFGSVSQGLAQAVEYLFSRQGRPNGYVLGEEGGGAFIAGLRYGEGRLNTKNAGTHKVYWQGPSIGWDIGGDGARTMMLVYNLESVDDLYRYYGGVNGSAYLVAGLGVSLYSNRNIYVAPIRSGVGARLGLNIGYLKLTREPTWNPF